MAAKELPDTAYLRECFDYDPGTGVLTWKRRPREHFPSNKVWRNWNNRFPGKEVGHIGSWGHVHTKLSCVSYPVHRLIWKMRTGEDPWPGVDHQNRDPADNRWSNLRLATSSQQTCNSVRSGRDLPKGVTRNGKGYMARCGINGQVIGLGTFPTPELAYAAYCAFAQKQHGVFFCGGDEWSSSPETTNDT